MYRRSPEPILWMVFSAGGVIAALFLPILIVLFAFAFPLGWLSSPTHAELLSLLRNPLTRLLLFALSMFSLFHAAHRLRYTLYDGLQIKHLNEIINPLVYGAAVAGSIWAGYLLVRL